MDATEYSARTNAYVSDYVRFADTKAGAVLALNGVLVGGIGLVAQDFRGNQVIEHWELALIVLAPTLVAAVGIVVGTLCALKVLFPDVTRLTPTRSKVACLNSFPDIAAMPENEYVAQVVAAQDASMCESYARHTSTLSRIADKKYGLVGRSVWWLRNAVIAEYMTVCFFIVFKLVSTG